MADPLTPEQRIAFEALKSLSGAIFDRLKADPNIATIDNGDGTITIMRTRSYMLDEQGSLKPEYKR